MILIDPGHTRKKGDPGSCFGLVREGEINFLIAEMIITGLRTYNIDCLLTHTGEGLAIDSNADINKRMSLIKKINPDAFISVHGNSFADPAAHGSETIVIKTGISTSRFADLIHSNMIAASGLYNRGIKSENIGVLRAAAALNIPAALIEPGFLSNQIDRSFMVNPDWQQKIADSVVKSVIDYFEISVPSSWDLEQAAAREWAIKKGITDGTRPGEPVTRSELWVMLHRLITK